MLIKYSRSPSEQIRQECEPKCGLQRPHSSHDTTMLPQICLPRTHSPLSPMKVSRFHQGRPRTARELARRAVPAWVTVKDATMLRAFGGYSQPSPHSQSHVTVETEA